MESPSRYPHLPLPTDRQPKRANLCSARWLATNESIDNFVRESISAPFVLKTRDVKAGDATIRVADLWFVVRGDLSDVNPEEVLSKAAGSTTEVGNMRFSSRLLSRQDEIDKKLDRLPALPGRDEWYTHATSRLLDRVNVEATDHIITTRTADSLVVATQTSRSWDGDSRFPNRWQLISRTGSSETVSPGQIYGGGGSYLKVTRLASIPEALFVEAHLAFVEPQAPGSRAIPISRSKFSPSSARTRSANFVERSRSAAAKK